MSEPWVEKWVSGDCTLYLGDSLRVMAALESASIDCVVTDPPYGHNNNNGDLIHCWEAALGRLPCGTDSPPARPIANDGEEANEVYKQALPELYRLLKPGCCCCCCCCGGGPDPQFARWSLWMDEVFKFKQMVVWDKGSMGMGWHYRRSYETVLVGEKPGAACHWFGGNDKENILRPGAYGIRKIIPAACDHPCCKPVELYQHFIRLHTQEGEVVLDPFMGDGPCGVACKRDGRKFVGIEIDPLYYERAKARILAEQRSTPLLDVVEAKAVQRSLLGDEDESP